MTIDLSVLERDTLLSWKPISKVLFPEEEVLGSRLGQHRGGAFGLNTSEAVILSSWAEESVDGHFGGGAIANITEKALLDKINRCLNTAES